MKVEIVHGDITKLNVDAVVNAANTKLLPGAGVDGAIHTAAGVELEKACRKLGGCQYGEAKITKGYNLPAKYVIHTVGPIFSSESNGHEANILYSCYYESLRLADENRLTSIAFPEISTGAFGFPAEEARTIANEAVDDFAEDYKDTSIQLVQFVRFSKS